MQTSSPLTTCKLAGQGVRTPSVVSVQATRSLCKAAPFQLNAFQRSTSADMPRIAQPARHAERHVIDVQAAT